MNKLFDEMKDEMKEFLIASYFGVDSNSDVDDIVERCIKKAYGDLSRNVPYRYSVSMLISMKKDENYSQEAETFEVTKREFYNAVFEIICEGIGSKKSAQSIMDDIEKKANIEYCNLWKPDEQFSYGLCQKWVNMTFKYLWLFGKCNIDEDNLDIPIDRFIIRAAISDDTYGQDYVLGIKVEGLTQDTAWSKLEKDLYEKIQMGIKKTIKEKFSGMSMLQWENAAWLEQAQIEAGM